MASQVYDENDDPLCGETLTIRLREPIKAGAQEYSEIVVREPKASEIGKVDAMLRSGMNVTAKTLRDQDNLLISLTSGVPIAVVEQLNGGVINRCKDFFEMLLTRHRPTGDSSAPS